MSVTNTEVPYVKKFKVGCFDCEADGDGEVLIFTYDTIADEDDPKQGFSINIDELNEIADIAYKHKISYENRES